MDFCHLYTPFNKETPKMLGAQPLVFFYFIDEDTQHLGKQLIYSASNMLKYFTTAHLNNTYYSNA